MRVVDDLGEMRAVAREWAREGRRVGLVPTLGALHAGHRALVEGARAAGCDRVVVSAFVNPLQFGPNEDHERYPRMPERDVETCREIGVDVLFRPAPSAMFPRDHSTTVAEDRLSAGLCGVSRPVHFRGVATAFVKLANLVRPSVAVLGRKEIQRVAVLRKVARDLELDLEILTVPTVRDPDGLAVAAVNAALTANQRQDALALHRALRRAQEMVEGGVRSVDRVMAEITHLLAQVRRLRVIYVSVVDPDTMEPRREIVPGHTVITLAAWLDEVRLVDNVEV